MTAISEKKAEASRRNGARGGGPASEAGRRRSALNAVKHGLSARTAVLLSDEDPEEFGAFEAALTQEMAPVDLHPPHESGPCSSPLASASRRTFSTRAL